MEHEIKPKDFPLASSDYEGDVSRLVNLMRLNSPKTPFIFARSSEAKKVESCLAWLGLRVEQEFKPRVMELESLIEELVKFTKNTPPTFAQIRRLLFETKFDFVQGNRCDFHCQTDKIACAIGNVRKYFYFLSEIMFDFYEYAIVEGHHFPTGFDNSCAASRAASTYSVVSSVAGDRDQDLDDTMSVSSSFSIGSYQHKRNVDPPRRPINSNKQKQSIDSPEILSQVSNFSIGSRANSFSSANSFATAATHFSEQSPGNSFAMGAAAQTNSFSAGPSEASSSLRRPNMAHKENFTFDSSPTSAYPNSVNSFSSSPNTVRSMSPSSVNNDNAAPRASMGRSRARNQAPFNQCQPAVSMGRGRGRGNVVNSSTAIPRRPNSMTYENGSKIGKFGK